jgi:hypothetical protein
MFCRCCSGPWCAAGLAILLALFLVGCSAPADEPAALTSTPAAPQSDPRLLAADLPMLPPSVSRAVRPADIVRATYEFAARHREVLDYVPCFCGCERGGHQGNHDCFVAGRDAEGNVTSWDAHAMACEICIDVAYDALQMFNSGASVVDIRAAIDRKYETPGGLKTPTPLPGHGGSTPH